MTASLSPVCPSGLSTRTPVADAEVVAAMRGSPYFRIGWLEQTLRDAADVLRITNARLRSNDPRRLRVNNTVEAIERSLRLSSEADQEAADASEKMLPVAAAGVAS